MKKAVEFFFLLFNFSILACQNSKDLKLVQIPSGKCTILETEVTQEVYKSVMGENPSFFKGENLPVENVSWYDAIYFCNALSKMHGLNEVYSVNGKKNVSEWNYVPHKGEKIEGAICEDFFSDGFRLPHYEEWFYACCGKN